MADKSKIEWCDATWNPVTGCTPVSAGCANCYAKRIYDRFNVGRPFSTPAFHADRMDEPLHYRKPRRIFTCSMSDLFHEDVSGDWIDQIIGTMCLAPQHTFMVLTKRPDLMLYYMNHTNYDKRTWPIKNLWLGVTAENQEMADQRIPILLQTPAEKRFVSVEPMLGPVDLESTFSVYDPYGEPSGPRCNKDGSDALSWVIVGGETGPSARFMHPHWVENLRDQCTEAGVPFFFKGWGTRMMKKTDPSYMKIDGREWKEFPT